MIACATDRSVTRRAVWYECGSAFAVSVISTGYSDEEEGLSGLSVSMSVPVLISLPFTASEGSGVPEFFVAVWWKEDDGLRGKKMRKSRSLHNHYHQYPVGPSSLMRPGQISLSYGQSGTHMIVKQDHWTPTCAMPNKPATQANSSTWRQQPMSSRLLGNTRILANAQVPLVVPRSTNHGDRP